MNIPCYWINAGSMKDGDPLPDDTDAVLRFQPVFRQLQNDKVEESDRDEEGDDAENVAAAANAGSLLLECVVFSFLQVEI